jgi:hypothetical protein
MTATYNKFDQFTIDMAGANPLMNGVITVEQGVTI